MKLSHSPFRHRVLDAARPPRPLGISLARLGSAAAVLAALSVAAQAAPIAWDVDGVTNGVITAGSGIWDNGVTANFTDLADTLAHFAWSNAGNAGDTAVFGGTGGNAPFTVTLAAGGITTGGLEFNTAGYTLAGGALTLGSGGTIITNVSATISSIIAGNGLASSGPASLLLRGANIFTGQFTIGSGNTVIAATGAALGAAGAGNETVVSAGGTLDLGGQNVSVERISLAGAGVGGSGALINSGIGQNNATALVTLTGNARLNAQGQLGLTAGSGTTTSYGRFDIRAASYVAGAQNLNLGGFTFTKIGRNQLSLVNAEVVAGNIEVNEGLLSIESDTRFVGGTSAITVNPGGRLGFFSSAATAVLPSITVAGGSLGDASGTSAAQTIASPIAFIAAAGEFWANSTNGTTFSGVVSGTVGSGVTGIAKRGAGLLALSNAANSFDAPLTIFQGNLQANYATPVAGGVTPGAPALAAGTPLGSAPTITLAGGTLNVRFDGANDATTQQISIGKNLVVDRAPSGLNLDRLTASGGTNKNLVIESLTFAAPSAANGYAIGQNQLTMAQGTNSFRLQLGAVTLNNDTVFNVGDFNYTGDITAAGGHSFVKAGGNSIGFVSGNHTFGAFFQLGASNTRVGSGFGTTTTNNTATIGSGPIFIAPGAQTTFRTPTNIAAGQTIELISQQVSQSAVNLEQFTAVPAGLRALSTGVLGLGAATAFGDIDLARIGDGTFRVGTTANLQGNGTVTGVIRSGAGNVVRVGATGTLTLSGTNRVTGTANLEVGSALINGGFRTINAGAQSGTVVLTGANNFTGGTTINRGSTLRFQDARSLGSGAVTLFGNATAEGAGSFINAAATGNLPVNLQGGATLRFDNFALTTAVDVDRWFDSEPIALINGTLQLDARNNLSTTNETVGPISFAGGSTISLQRSNAGAAQIVQLQTPSLLRAGRGTVEITRSGSSAFGTNVRLLTTGAAPVVTNGMVQPFITVIDATRLQNFATYDAAQGFLNATYTNTVTTAAFPTGLTAGTQIVYADFAAGVTTTTLADNPVIYALKVGAGQQATNATTIAASGVNNTITLRSGGLIISGDSNAGNYSTSVLTGGTFTGTATINPNLVFNDGVGAIEGLVDVRTGHTAILNGTITGSGLTKFGAGTLNLTANSGALLSGPVAANQGILQLFGPTATGTYNVAGTSSLVLAGGQINLRSNNSAVTGTINTTMQMGLTIAAGIPTATLDVNRSTPDVASSGTFIFQPAVAGSPGLQLLGAEGPQGQTFNVSGANYNVTFATNATNSINGSATFNITGARTLQLDDGPTITGIAPTITKSGDGTLIYARAAGETSVPIGTTIVVNAGVFQPNSILAFGTVAQTSIVLNGGQLNLRRDTAAIWSGNTVGGGAGYRVTVNGNSTLSADRLGAGANFRLGLGALTINGTPTLTVSSGNGFSAEFQSAQLNGLPTFLSTIQPGDVNTAFRISGLISGGGFIKSGVGHMHLLGSNNTYDGGTWINQGILRVRTFNALGTGPVILNPGATIDFNSQNNLAPDQPFIVRGNSTFLPMISVNGDFPHPTEANVDTSAAPVGIVGLSNTTNGFYDTPIDLSALYGGNWYLGGIATGAYDARYTATTLGAGAGNTYRIGGGGLAFLLGVDGSNIEQNNVLTGANSVVFGHDSGNLRGANTTTFQVVLGGVQDFTGSTLIHRGTATTLSSANDGTRSGLSNSAVNVFGNLILRSNASLAIGGGSTNAVTLHPGSALHFDNANGSGNSTGTLLAANNADRWGDTTAIGLNGALLDLIGTTDAISTETVGNVNFARGARIRVARGGTTGTAALTLAQLNATAGKGHTLTLQTSAAGTLGGVDQLLVQSGAPTPVNGMVSPSFVNATDNTFVTYGGAGFANVAYDKSLNANYAAGSLLPTDKVDVITAALALSDNPTVYALRTSQNINVASAFNRIAIRSGGLIATAGTIQPDLVFNDGTANIEARIYNSGTVNLNGALTANGITKFGVGALNINIAQPSYASGWTVNAGTLQVNDLQGLGQSVAGNAITLNATQTTTGSVAQTLAGTNLTLARNTGSPEIGVFTGGAITVVNEATIRVAAGDDRNLQIPNVTLQSTGASSVGFTFDVPNNRYRATIPMLTLASDATVRVLDSGATTDTGRITAGVVTSLVGSGVKLNKIGNRTLELAGDNSATFTGGSVVVSQGTVRVLNNGALGSAATIATIERNATLEIGVGNFAPIASVTQQSGSIERWNVENARPATYILPAGVNLQLNTNLLGAHVIGLTGGSLEGFLHSDHVAAAVQRTVGANVTLSLLADSFVGQNVLLGQGYDLGRQPTVTGPFTDNVTGSYLQINGTVTGSFNLTKTGLDTVVLANTGNAYNNTIVDMGVLRIGATNALPTNGVLTTRFAGTFDLYGSNQAVAGLGIGAGSLNPGGVGIGSSGRIVNSATTENTLTVNTASDDFIYNGTIERTIALVKNGANVLTLSGVNSFTGGSTVNAGTLRILSDDALGAASSGVVLNNNAILQAAGTITSARAFILGAGGGTIDTNSSDLTLIAGSSVSGGKLTKIGPGTLTLAGTQTYAELVAEDGVTTLGTALGTGASIVTANAATNFDVSQTLAALNIGPAGIVTLTASAPGALPDFGSASIGEAGGVQAVPEPGAFSLLAVGLLSVLGRRRRAQ